MIGPFRIKYIGLGIFLSGVVQVLLLGFQHPLHLPEVWVTLGALLVFGGIRLERWQRHRLVLKWMRDQ